MVLISKDSNIINVFHLSPSDLYTNPKEIEFSIPTESKIQQVNLLGSKEKLKWKLKGNRISVKAPKSDLDYAAVIQVRIK